MTRDERLMGALLIITEELFGEEIAKHLAESRKEPEAIFDPETDVILDQIELSNVEKSAWMLVPNVDFCKANLDKRLHMNAVVVLGDLFWAIIRERHGLQMRSLGIREGWRLVEVDISLKKGRR